MLSQEAPPLKRIRFSKKGTVFYEGEDASSQVFGSMIDLNKTTKIVNKPSSTAASWRMQHWST